VQAVTPARRHLASLDVRRHQQAHPLEAAVVALQRARAARAARLAHRDRALAVGRVERELVAREAAPDRGPQDLVAGRAAARVEADAVFLAVGAKRRLVLGAGRQPRPGGQPRVA
jgi:hypothetical protein